jgi:energy-coupling factor transporter transmembrane protein EcfT
LHGTSVEWRLSNSRNVDGGNNYFLYSVSFGIEKMMTTGITAYHYQSGKTMVHTLDSRFKLILMALASITVLNASALALFIMSSSMVVLSWYIRLPLFSAAKELRYFFILLLMVFAARVLSTPGEPFFQIGFLKIGRQGLVDAGIVCWRLLLVVALGLIIIATTRISEIKRAAAWFFKPVPGLPEKRLAVTLGLIVRFIPVIFEKAGDVTAAQQARCIGARKNPVFRIKAFTIPLLRGVFRDAGNLAMAMEARGYSEHGIRKMTPATAKDWAALIAGSGICLVAFLV